MKRKAIRWICLLTVCTAAALLGNYFARRETAEPVTEERPRIAGTTEVEITYHYKYCGHEISGTGDARYVGMDREEFRREEPKLLIREFTAERVYAERYFSLYCPEHRIVRLQEGRLCVVSSEPGEEALTVRRELGITEAEVLPQYREVLRKGMVVTLGRTVEDILETVGK